MTTPLELATWLRKRADKPDPLGTDDRHNMRLAAAMVEGQARRIEYLECERACAEQPRSEDPDGR